MLIKTRNDLKDFLKTSPYTVFKFSGEWCKPCKRIQPCVNKCVEEALGENCNMVYIDVDESEDVCSYLKIRRMPTFIFFVGEDRMWVLESSKEEEVINFYKKVKMVVANKK